MSQKWNDPNLPWQNSNLPWKNTSLPWNDTNLPWKQGGVDPLAPGAPTLDLVAGSDTGSSNTDNITSATEPGLTLTGAVAWAENDEIQFYDNGVALGSPHTVTAGEAGGSTINLGLDPLTEGSHSLQATHTRDGHTSPKSTALVVTVITSTPTITSSNAFNWAEGTAFSQQLTALDGVSSGSGTWAITGGADELEFDITSGGLLTSAASNKDFENPDDAGTPDGVYEVEVTFTDRAGNDSTPQTIEITLTDVIEGGGTDAIELENTSDVIELEDSTDFILLEDAA